MQTSIYLCKEGISRQSKVLLLLVLFGGFVIYQMYRKTTQPPLPNPNTNTNLNTNTNPNPKSNSNKPCDWPTSAVRYKDLMDKFGHKGMPTQYKNHYLQHGKNEARICQADPSIPDCNTYLNAENSKDLKEKFGTDCTAAVKHYIHHGRNESWRKSHR